MRPSWMNEIEEMWTRGKYWNTYVRSVSEDCNTEMPHENFNDDHDVENPFVDGPRINASDVVAERESARQNGHRTSNDGRLDMIDSNDGNTDHDDRLDAFVERILENGECSDALIRELEALGYDTNALGITNEDDDDGDGDDDTHVCVACNSSVTLPDRFRNECVMHFCSSCGDDMYHEYEGGSHEQ